MQINKKAMKKLFFAAMAALGLLASCDKDLDIQQAYSFSLETIPIPKHIDVIHLPQR